MIRILQVGLGPNPGGIENCIMNYCRHMNKEKFHFDFADIYGQGLAYQDEMQKLGCQIFVMPNYKQQPWANLWTFHKIFSMQHYDIVHINVLSAANIIPLLAGKLFADSKLIVHCHNSDVPGGFLRKALNSANKFLFRLFADKKLACGRLAGQWMWGSKFSKENIIYNAVDTELYKPNNSIRKIMRQKCGYTDSDIVLGFVGRLCEQKNPMFLLDILKELCKEDTKYKLLVIGDGEYKERFEAKVKALDLESLVYMAGVQNNVPDWYQAMDVFLLPSLFEGLPVVAIEAQAAGLKCLLSDRISREVDVGGEIKFIDILEEKFWNQEICSILNNSKEKICNLNEQYSIVWTVKRLEKQYLDIMKLVQHGSL